MAADVPAAQPVPAPAPGAKPHGRTPTPAMGSMAVRSPAEPLAPEMTARGTPPVPAVPLIPARPAKHTTPPPITPAKAIATSADPRGGKTEGSTPPVVPVPPAPAPFQLAQPAPARSGKPAPASNDLKPASGTIEAKARHSNHLPPAPAPIEIADQPNPTPEAEPAQPVNQVMIPSRPTTSRRARVARKGLGEHSVKVYILIGLAIGAGIVVTYWAYWYLPFFHH